jgi:hypothetical protein
LTAYLDGEVEPDLGSAIRGHLRGCDACRGLASDEACLRDGLRALPAVDPPASLWAGVQARLAQEEVADSKRPAWRRAVSRWMHVVTPMKLATGGFVMAAAIALVWWKTQPADEPAPLAQVDPIRDHNNVGVQGADPAVTAADDVTKDLAKDAQRKTSAWQAGVEELIAEAASRKEWSPEARAAFDAKVARIRAAVAAAPEGRARDRIWQRANQDLLITLSTQVASRDRALAGGVE